MDGGSVLHVQRLSNYPHLGQVNTVLRIDAYLIKITFDIVLSSNSFTFSVGKILIVFHAMPSYYSDIFILTALD